MTRLETMEDLAVVLPYVCSGTEADPCPFLEMDFACPFSKSGDCAGLKTGIDYKDWKNVLDDLER